MQPALLCNPATLDEGRRKAKAKSSTLGFTQSSTLVRRADISDAAASHGVGVVVVPCRTRAVLHIQEAP